MVKDLDPGGAGEPEDITAVGDDVFFTVYDFDHGEELWFSDGTDTGTYLVKDIVSDRDAPGPTEFVDLHGTLIFVIDDGTLGAELWRSDGTETGTVLLKDINPGFIGSNPSKLMVAGGWVFFSANDGIHGEELWMSDGTTAGTQLAMDVARGGGSSSPEFMTLSGTTLYFVANDLSTGRELWAIPFGTDLQVTKTGGPASITVGEYLTYTVGCTNAGNLMASNLTLVDTMPAGFQLDYFQASDPSCAAVDGSIQCYFPEFNPGESVTFTIGGVQRSPGWVTNTAEATADKYDLYPQDNRPSVTSFVAAPITGLTIHGPVTGTVYLIHAFTANVHPITATSPITYSWLTDGQEPVIYHGELSHTVNYFWMGAGNYQVQVTVMNSISIFTATTTISVTKSPYVVYLPNVFR
jgi:uncharacterized repeat protein (TIGR01451 family)